MGRFFSSKSEYILSVSSHVITRFWTYKWTATLTFPTNRRFLTRLQQRRSICPFGTMFSNEVLWIVLSYMPAILMIVSSCKYKFGRLWYRLIDWWGFNAVFNISVFSHITAASSPYGVNPGFLRLFCITGCFSTSTVNHFPYTDAILRLCGRRRLKTLWQK